MGDESGEDSDDGNNKGNLFCSPDEGKRKDKVWVGQSTFPGSAASIPGATEY